MHEETDRNKQDTGIWVEDKINEMKEELLRKEELSNKKRKALKEIIETLEVGMKKAIDKEKAWIRNEKSYKEKIKTLENNVKRAAIEVCKGTPKEKLKMLEKENDKTCEEWK